MRDTYYTLNAFNNIGHFEESEKYFHYILNTTSGENDRYQPLYGIDGKKVLTEEELPLQGYLDNQPVRIGNDAYTHIQNDVYGQLLLAILPTSPIQAQRLAKLHFLTKNIRTLAIHQWTKPP